MNPLDIFVVVVILASAIFALARGFIREILSIAAWLGSALITIYGFRFAIPFAERVASPGPFANGVAAAAVFVIALIVLTIVTSTIAHRVSQSGASSIDRLFGLIFGLARGALLVTLCYIALAWYMPPDKTQPDWIAQARTLPLLRIGADLVESWVPPNWRERAHTTSAEVRNKVDEESGADSAIRALSTPRQSDQPAPGAAKDYNQGNRTDMNRLIQQQQGQ